LARRLTTILAADVVGYGRLMGADEAGTLSALKTVRRDIVKPKELQYHGRTVKLMGDGALMEFASVVDAVTFAVEVQSAMARRNAEAADDRQIVYRMGINIGDIIVEGDDIYGDGVNVAARLEALCEPGGVCLSRNVYNQVKGKLDLTFEHLGEKEVKNIAEPVSVYRVALDDKAAALVTEVMPEAAAPKRRSWTIPIVLVAVSILVGGGALWWRPWTPREEPADIDDMAFPLPDKPSVAVLPFANLSDDPSQDYFADGMTEDLITDLSKISDLFVIARNSSFAYKGREVKVRQVAEELGVRYVLEGSVRRVGDQVRINTQLVDATTGGHVWAERYDGKLEHIFAVQDAIMAKVVEALELHLTDRERARRDEGPQTDSLEAYDLVLRARKLLTRFDHKAAVEAHGLLQRAIEIDPSYVEAYTLLGFYFFDEWRVWGRKRDQNLAHALELGNAAVELDPSNPAPHVLLAMVYQWRREFDEADAAADRALALQPKDAIALSNLGSMLGWSGRSEAALEVLQQAIRLDPFHPPNYLERLAFAHASLGDYEQCIEATSRGIALDPNYVGLHVDAATCYAALGREQEARAAAAEILRTNPRFTLKAFASYAPFTHERDRDWKMNMLRKAGVPE